MPHWVRSLATGAAARIPTLLTLAALGGLMFWGRHNGWRLWPARAADQGAGKQAPAEPAIKVLAASPVSAPGSNDPSASGPVRIEFPSADAVDRVGIQVAPVQVRGLARTVTAPGMADYDPGRYARLTARAAGTVWRVYKEIGDPLQKGDVLALIDAAEVGKAKGEFLQAAALAASRATTRARLEALSRSGSTSEAALRQARINLQEAQIRLAAAEQTLANLGLPVRAEDMQGLSAQEASRRVRFLGVPEAVAGTLDPRTTTANLLPLTAPFDSQVVERNVATGEAVQVVQTKSLFVVGDIR